MVMRVRLSIVAGLLTLTPTLSAQAVDPALTAAIAARDKASVSRDAAGVAKYTADDYFAINPGGVLTNKQQRIAQLKIPAAAGSAPPAAQRTEFVRMYGTDAAVARMRVTDNRQLLVWIKTTQGWQAAAIHVVPDAVPAPLPPPERPKTPQPSVLQAPSGLSGDRAAVFAAFKQIQDAFFSGDRATYDKLTASEHARLAPGGMLRFANESGANIDGPRVQPKYSNIEVQAWGRIGVVRWLETLAGGRQQWLTRVFNRTGSGWQQVATASSVAGNPPVMP
jgi:hypothetical protein